MADTGVTDSSNGAKFPTVGLKSLLQNSDLLEILLKPLSKSNDSTDGVNLGGSPVSSATNMSDESTDLLVNSGRLDVLTDLGSFVDSDELKFKTNFEWGKPDDLLENKASKLNGLDDAEAKLYENAFLGPNLWEKDDLFQGGVKFEHLEIDEFLNENGLNETDVEFLDQIQKIDTLSTLTSNPGLVSPHQDVSNKTNRSSYSSLEAVTIVSGSTFEKEAQPSKQNSKLDSKTQKSQQQFYKKESAGSTSKAASFNDDWNSSSNEMSMSSMEDYDPKLRKFSDDDLRPQPVLRKSKKQFVPSELKDDKYWARRKKNNIAAKRSRDARRVKENQIAIRASYLERENDALRKQMEDFKRENKVLKSKVERYEHVHPDLKLLD